MSCKYSQPAFIENSGERRIGRQGFWLDLRPEQLSRGKKTPLASPPGNRTILQRVVLGLKIIFIAIISHLWHIIAMKWEELLQMVGREPYFHSSLLVAGGKDPVDLGRQLSRWVKSGRLIQLRRRLYVLSERYQKITPHPFVLANQLRRGSYVSLQSALGYYGLIPEYVPSITSVTTGRPETLSNPFGTYIFRHIKKGLFFGYQLVNLGEGQSAFLALPEKALLDLLYLTPDSDNPDYLQELRLQNTESLNLDLLLELARRTQSKKLLRASREVSHRLKRLER